MIITLGVAIWLFLHPVHVTITSIDHVKGTDSLKVFMRMYYDDFLLDYCLFDSTNDSVKNITIDQLLPAKLISSYITGKVSIIVNNKVLKGKLLNQNLADNEISLNLLYTTEARPQIIRVRNLIMTELYSDQTNMLIVRAGNTEKGVMLTPEITEQTFIINENQ